MNNFNKPFFSMTLMTLLISTIMALSSTNWLFLWMAMEINMLSFIPLMTHSKSNQETEATIKYFMAQALGSSMMLMTSLSQWTLSNTHMNLLLTAAILLKLGMAPFHFWFPSVMTSLSWMSCMVLATWQKLAPLVILAFLLNNSYSTLIITVAMINAILGGLMGMNQSHLRTIMAYSSITHMGWMSSMLYIMKPMLTLTYFIMYCLVISPLFLMMSNISLINNTQFNKINSMSPLMQLMIPLLLLSLSGMPPFTGFIPKWITISSLCTFTPFILLILISGAMMNAYFYLNIMFNSLLSMSSMPQLTSYNSTKAKPMIIIAFASLFALPIMFI